MERAARLLRETDATVAEVGARVAYSSEFAFNRAFCRHHGISPGRYRSRSRAGCPGRLDSGAPGIVDHEQPRSVGLTPRHLVRGVLGHFDRDPSGATPENDPRDRSRAIFPDATTPAVCTVSVPRTARKGAISAPDFVGPDGDTATLLRERRARFVQREVRREIAAANRRREK